MTKVSEFRGSSVDELTDQLAKLKKEQFNLRFQRASGQLENTSRVRVVRHDIARILTVLNQRGESTVIASPAPKAAKTKKAKETKKEAAPKQAKAAAKDDKKQPAKKSRTKKE